MSDPKSGKHSIWWYYIDQSGLHKSRSIFHVLGYRHISSTIKSTLSITHWLTNIDPHCQDTGNWIGSQFGITSKSYGIFQYNSSSDFWIFFLFERKKQFFRSWEVEFLGKDNFVSFVENCFFSLQWRGKYLEEKNS